MIVNNTIYLLILNILPKILLLPGDSEQYILLTST